MTDLARFLRRSPLARVFPASAEWVALDDAAAMARVSKSDVVGDLAIADLSPLPRLGFKGRDTISAVKDRGVAVEAEPNRAFRQPDGGLCLVLGAGEVLLLGPLDGSGATLAEMERSWPIEEGRRIYPVPRRDSHAWFAVAGLAAPTMFAKLCAVDLRPHKFMVLAIAQTSVARLNAIVLRADRAGQTVYHLLADSASAAYLLECLRDAAEEFGGTLIGLDALRS